MTRPWVVLDRVASDHGILELRRRGERDFLITFAGRVLMASGAHRSEVALATLACVGLERRRAPRVLIGGLGMGFTLRAALDALPGEAHVTVAELNRCIVDWCRGELAGLSRGAVADPRVEVVLCDVADAIGAAAARGPRFDAILLDLYEGPAGAADATSPVYGAAALATTRGALAPGGAFAVWAERPDTRFERRLRAAGFGVARHRPGRGGLRHVVYLARPAR